MSTDRPSRYDYEFDPDDAHSTAAIVCRLAGQGRDVLELGCAAGAMTQVLARHYGCRVTGVELDPVAAEAARQYADTVHVLSLEDPAWQASLKGKTYDTVLAADVLEHLHDPAACLQQLHSLLKEDGRLIISVPNLAHGGVIAALLCGDFEYRDVGLLDRTHVHFFTPSTLRRMLEAHHYTVEEETQVNARAWHPEFARYWAELPPAFQNWLENGPVSAAYQSILVARRGSSPDTPARATDQTDATDRLALSEELKAWLAQMPQPAPDLAAHAAAETAEIEPAHQESHDPLQEQVHTLNARLHAMETSLSWRLTAPLRALARLLRREPRNSGFSSGND